MRLYDTTRWRKESAEFKRDNPVCVFCQRQGKASPVQVVDHIKPHKGDEDLFWDQDNWQPLCKHCHDVLKQTKERRGLMPGHGLDGLPIDGDHPWLAGGG
jgi:5-methylcytosine-specific restriction enzyme A